MRAHSRALVVIAAFVAACGGGGTSSSQTSGPTESPGPSIASTPVSETTATPAPSVPRHEVTDILLDPLPRVTPADVLETDTNAKTLAGVELGGALTTFEFSALSQATWLCQAALSSVPDAERLAQRRMGCLQAIVANWSMYVETVRGEPEPAYESARTIYAYAIAQSFTGGADAFDADLLALLQALVEDPGPTPDPAGLQSIEALMASVAGAIDRTVMADALDRALLASPHWLVDGWTPVGTLGDGQVSTHFDACATQSDFPIDQLSGCAGLAGALYGGYRVTGETDLYDAAVMAYRLGAAVAKALGGSAVDEYKDLVRTVLANP